MNDDDAYMGDFLKVYQPLERWGPGSEGDTLKALSMVAIKTGNILEVGCGKGLTAITLAENTDAKITALDTEQSALDRLEWRFEERFEERFEQRAEQQITLGRIDTVCADMADLPFPNASFDLIWSEGSAYIIGVENALKTWKPILRANGYLVLSDLVWRTDAASREPREFWQQEYPDMQMVENRIEQMTHAGYRVVGHFPLSAEAWSNYFEPLAQRVKEVKSVMPLSAALDDIEREVGLCTRYANEFGYHMFILESV